MTIPVAKLVWPVLLAIGVFAQSAGPAQEGFRISGTVVSSVTGQPLAQVRVFLSRTEARQDREVVITGSDGRFSFDGIPPGKYVLAAGKPGFLMQGFEAHENYSSAIVTGPGMSAENLVFRIHPAAVISGQIVNEQDEPVRDVQVVLFRSWPEDGKRTVRPSGATNSDDRGQYRFGELPPGTYFVVVCARPWYAAYTANNANGDVGQSQNSSVPFDMTYPVIYYSGATDSSQATPLNLAAGDRVSADFALIPERALHILVRTPKLNASQGYSVMMIPEAFQGSSLPMPVSMQTSMSKPGEIEIAGLAPGQYRMQVVFPGKETFSYSQELDLQNDTEIDTSTSSQSRSISGTIRAQGGSPLPPGGAVFLRNSVSGEGSRARVAPDGQFQFGSREVISSGTYEVAVAYQDIFLVSVSATGARVVGRTIDIRGSDPIRLSLVVSQGIGRVDGTAVSGDDAKPMAGAMVLLVPDDPANNSILIRRDQSDSDGTFTLPSVVPGHYTLLAIRNGWDLEWMNPAVLRPYLQGGQPVEVQKNGRYNLKVRVQ
jgi:hypothetical protein